MEQRRPDPDALLARVAGDEAAAQGGRLKVFLGAAPGVGKTYAMLNAARELEKEGVDVVVGIVETHGREETEALLEGLEVLARRRLDYKGRVLAELDLDALLARRPRVALVDELAHRNAPGSRHERRHQDIEELLDAGIDVYTTVNIQHLESLNDVVAQITGVRVRETVPDAFFDRLRDVVLIDLPPRELIERLRQGKVYVPEQARAALQAFFSPSNLTALRELAMQTVAERIDADLREYQVAHGQPSGAPIRPRVLVAVDGHAHTEYLVRRARRIAERRQAPWTVAHVDTGRGGQVERDTLQAAFQLARRLGAEAVTLRGANVAEELLRYADSRNVSSILIGQTRERPIARILNRTITQRLLDQGGDFELTIVNTPTGRLRMRRRRRRAEPAARQVREYGVATLATVVAVLLSAALDDILPVPSLALIFITAVLAIAVRSSIGVALYAAALSFVSYNFFFTEPRYTLSISKGEDLVAVVAFLIAAVVCSQLAARLRAQVVMLRAANVHTRALQALGARLARAADEAEVVQAGCQELATALGCEAILLRGEGDGGAGLRIVAREPATAVVDPNDVAAADWVAGHAQAAGRYTGTLTGSAWWFLPLVVERGCLGAAGLRFPAAQVVLSAEQRVLAEALVQQIALAADRAHLVADLETARVESETERLRTALLSSVSHDLRSPLASVIGAASSLSAYGETMPEADRRELLDSIRSEGERLDRYIQNLLDMTRLGSGRMKLQRDWVGLDEVLASAVMRLARQHPAVRVETRHGSEPPLLYVHPALIEQALFNILENAAKVSPPGEPVLVTAERAGNKLVVEVTDRGPGIPEEERRRIFDMFYSVQRGDRSPRGSGLGLTIVRGMIGAHQGRVEALPGPGGAGTTIRVTLPLPEPPRADQTAEDE
jgi:two-component system, OmpR family, sensor histidine kinase KdpD